MTRRTLADQLMDAILTDVIGSTLKEGDSLPSTAVLAARYGVSRTVVREALAALTGRGILVNSQGRESVVALPDAIHLSRQLKFRVERTDVSIADLLQVRLGIEVIGAELAAARSNEESRRELETLIEALEDAVDDEDEYRRQDLALHRAIAVASGNSLIVLVLDSLTELLLEFRKTATSRRRERGESLKGIVQVHRRIVERITAGDAPGAGAAMREHLETAAIDAASSVTGREPGQPTSRS